MKAEIECQFKAARCHTAAVDNSVANVIYSKGGKFMLKTKRTLFAGLLTFVMVFATIVPMSAEIQSEANIEFYDLQQYMIGVAEDSEFMFGLQQEMVRASYENNNTNSVNPLSSVWYSQQVVMALPTGTTPSRTLNFQGHLSGGWHVGTLTLTSSENRGQSPNDPNLFIWVVYYSGWVHLAGRSFEVGQDLQHVSSSDAISFSSHQVQETISILLPHGTNPPRTLTWNGHINGIPHFGVLNYSTSGSSPGIRPGETFWTVTYSGMVHPVGR
ncbi:MAG: hypothetical protein FWE33_01670 [Defluviitaleaceae bacterium]|nr:hypothetical protein [Defluviitaleaceae bacterium]